MPFLSQFPWLIYALQRRKCIQGGIYMMEKLKQYNSESQGMNLAEVGYALFSQFPWLYMPLQRRKRKQAGINIMVRQSNSERKGMTLCRFCYETSF